MKIMPKLDFMEYNIYSPLRDIERILSTARYMDVALDEALMKIKTTTVCCLKVAFFNYKGAYLKSHNLRELHRVVSGFEAIPDGITYIVNQFTSAWSWKRQRASLCHIDFIFESYNELRKYADYLANK